MQGLILCGGQSTRMGTDKGLILNEVRTWAQTAMDRLAALSIPVSISVNALQYDSYRAVFPDVALVQDDPTLGIRGPLLGVLSAHVAHPAAAVFVLACDMPLMDVSIPKQLFEQYRDDEDHEAFVFTNEEEPEPLCGIYTTAGLRKIFDALQSGSLQKHSMKYALGLLAVRYTALTDIQKPCFRNFNAHAALNGL
jgi:molybdopterin-guanine dinucleotide biosynthesis protein A